MTSSTASGRSRERMTRACARTTAAAGIAVEGVDKQVAHDEIAGGGAVIVVVEEADRDGDGCCGVASHRGPPAPVVNAQGTGEDRPDRVDRTETDVPAGTRPPDRGRAGIGGRLDGIRSLRFLVVGDAVDGGLRPQLPPTLPRKSASVVRVVGSLHAAWPLRTWLRRRAKRPRGKRGWLLAGGASAGRLRTGPSQAHPGDTTSKGCVPTTCRPRRRDPT